MGGGNLANQNKKKGFAISGIMYPLLILTLFLVVQMLFMLQTRKNVLDKTRMELADSINKSNQVYNNEELSAIVDELRSNYQINHTNNIRNFYTVSKIINTNNCDNVYLSINNISGPLFIEVNIFGQFRNINYGGYIKYTLGAIASNSGNLYGLGTNIDKQGSIGKFLTSITPTYADRTLKLKLDFCSNSDKIGSEIFAYTKISSINNLANTNVIFE